MIRQTLTVMCAIALGACATEVDIALDLDEDGLLDFEEEELGTDPMSADSDGDDHADGDEIAAGTDPLDFDDHPYKGGYEIDGDCRDSIVAEGNEIGSVTDNIKGPDQFGEMVDSYDFCGKYLLLINALDT